MKTFYNDKTLPFLEEPFKILFTDPNGNYARVEKSNGKKTARVNYIRGLVECDGLYHIFDPFSDSRENALCFLKKEIFHPDHHYHQKKGNQRNKKRQPIPSTNQSTTTNQRKSTDD